MSKQQGFTVTNISQQKQGRPLTGRNNKKASDADSKLIGFFAFIFTIIIILLLLDGWLGRHDTELTAERGAGYWYGIIGGVMMLFLLFYTAVKRLRWLSFIGSVKFWYRLHIIFGVAGPVFILYHANFSFGSPNSRNATIAMLIVVVSGIIGRFFYKKIYNSLTDHQYTVAQLQQKLQQDRELMLKHFGVKSAHANAIEKFDQYILAKEGFWAHLFAMPIVAMRARRLKRSLIRSLKKQIKRSQAFRSLPGKKRRAILRKFRRDIRTYYLSVRKYFSFHVYEKMFSIWALFHFPMFIVMIFLGILHVISVHMY